MKLWHFVLGWAICAAAFMFFWLAIHGGPHDGPKD
jgi:hypothetical protein